VNNLRIVKPVKMPKQNREGGGFGEGENFRVVSGKSVCKIGKKMGVIEGGKKSKKRSFGLQTVKGGPPEAVDNTITKRRRHLHSKTYWGLWERGGGEDATFTRQERESKFKGRNWPPQHTGRIMK